MTSDLDEIMATLLDCTTPPELRETWRSLSDAERAALRWSPVLARHAERVLLRAFEQRVAEKYSREIGEHLSTEERRARALRLAEGARSMVWASEYIRRRYGKPTAQVHADWYSRGER